MKISKEKYVESIPGMTGVHLRWLIGFKGRQLKLSESLEKSTELLIGKYTVWNLF